MKISDWSRFITCFAGAGLLGGCALRPQVTHMAVEYNEFVAQATNRQTALNILRARDREPLHFTSFTKVVGSAQVEGTAGFGDTINTDETAKAPSAVGAALAVTSKTLKSDALAPTLGVKVDTGTDFEIAINSTDDFWKGILEPVSPSLLVYYLRQGWMPDLISYLFIDRMDFSVVIKPKPGFRVAETLNEDGSVFSGVLTSINNEPARRTPTASTSNPPPATLFDGLTRCRPLSITSKAASSRFIPISSVADLKGVTADLLSKVKTADEIKAALPEDSKLADPKAPKPAGAGSVTAAPLGVDESEPQDYSLTLGARVDDASCGSIDALLARQIAIAIPNGFKSVDATRIVSLKAADKDFTETFLRKYVSPSDGALVGNHPARQKGVGAAAIESSGGGIQFKSKGLCDPLVDKEKYTCDLTISVTLRSIEGVIYYLGEIQRQNVWQPMLRQTDAEPDTSLLDRAALNAPTTDKTALTVHEYTVPIFVIRKAIPSDGRNPFVTVDYKGDRWIVPSSGQVITSEAGRSSEVVTLVEQLLNLYRSQKDFPSTPFVKILN